MKDLIEKLESTISNAKKIDLLEGKQNIASLTLKINEMIMIINNIDSTKRDRGPKSEHKMKDEDARRIMLGDLKDTGHKQCAEILGLSYGQVYSARNGYTFKIIYQEMKKES